MADFHLASKTLINIIQINTNGVLVTCVGSDSSQDEDDDDDDKFEEGGSSAPSVFGMTNFAHAYIPHCEDR